VIFFDWVPVPATARKPQCLPGVILGDNLAELRALAAYSGVALDCKDIGLPFAFRDDGFLIFSLDCDQEDDAESTINQACIVSVYLKNLLGHTHIFDRDRHLLTVGGAEHVLHKYPVVLNKILDADVTAQPPAEVAKKLMLMMVDDSNLLGLEAKRRFGLRRNGPSWLQGVGGHNRSALTVLLRKFDSLFPRVLTWTSSYKNPPVVYSIRFRRRVYWYVVAYLLIVFGVAVYSADPAFSSDMHNMPSIFLLGLFLGILWILFFHWIGKTVSSVFSRVAQSKVGFQTLFAWRPRGAVAYRATMRWADLRYYLPDLYFLILFTSPLLLCIAEIPSFIDFFKIDKIIEQFGLGDWMSKASSVASIERALGSGNFPSIFLTRLSETFFLFVFLMYVVEVKLYRQKIDENLTRLIGHMRYGSILRAIVSTIEDRAGIYTNDQTGYSNSISIVEVLLERERFKRRNVTVAYLCSLVFALTIFLYEVVYGQGALWNKAQDLYVLFG
jgi:hypothetical protein